MCDKLSVLFVINLLFRPLWVPLLVSDEALFRPQGGCLKICGNPFVSII
jgi:hypothetical protein